MRFLGIGDYCDLAALYLNLIDEGHEVKVFIGDARCKDILDGLVPKICDWRSELSWIAEAGKQGVIIFEDVSKDRGRLQDELRAKGFNVVGGSAFGDRLENDRFFAQEMLRKIGLNVAASWSFIDRQTAIDFIAQRPERYVLKFDGVQAAAHNYVGQFADGCDVRAFLERLPRTAEESFLLMEHVDGVEMGVGAYFDGEKFLRPACLDWEHKRFFPGDLGELTGEMGTIATYDQSSFFFERTLGRFESHFRRSRHCGYVNLNTIVNKRGVWPLEFTCRFGYPGFAVLSPLQRIPWSRLLSTMCHRPTAEFDVLSGFSAGTVLTVPPFPYEKSQVNAITGLPVSVVGSIGEEDRRHIHYCELARAGDELVTAGAYGWAMVVTGVGADIKTARESANALANRVRIPNLRYRRDIGDRLINGDLARIQEWRVLESTQVSKSAGCAARACSDALV